MPLQEASWGKMIYIHYNNGRVLQGVVLAFGDRMVRVAVKDSDDAVEFRLVNQVWVSEDCEVVKLDFAERLAPVESEEADLLENMFRFELQPVSIQRVM
jgi:hypothetical protein